MADSWPTTLSPSVPSIVCQISSTIWLATHTRYQSQSVSRARHVTSTDKRTMIAQRVSYISWLHIDCVCSHGFYGISKHRHGMHERVFFAAERVSSMPEKAVLSDDGRRRAGAE